MGGTLAELWAKAGHEVMISSRHPEELKAQAQAIGPKVHVGTVREAAAFGPVVVIAMPYGKWPEISDEIKSETPGKTVIDLTNPYPDRDGPMAEQARKETTGIANPKYLPGAHLVRAFNSIIYTDLRSQAHRPGEPAAIAVAGDDARRGRRHEPARARRGLRARDGRPALEREALRRRHAGLREGDDRGRAEESARPAGQVRRMVVVLRPRAALRNECRGCSSRAAVPMTEPEVP